MAEFLQLPDRLEFWHWWVLAALCLSIEVFAPTTLFLWTGASAVVVGGVLFFVPEMSWQAQTVLFAVLSVVSVFAWRAYARAHPAPVAEPTLNRRGAQYVGRVFVLEEAMTGGAGRLRIDDTTWKVVDESGADRPAGTRLRVRRIDGATLVVEPVAEEA